MSPYSGSAFHHVPLALALFYPFRDSPPWLHHAIFTGFDLLAGFLLWLAVASYRRSRHDIKEGLVLKAIEGKEAAPKQPAASNAPRKQLAPSNASYWPSPQYLPELAALIFLLNPLTIANCVAQSLQTVENTVLIALVCAAVRGKFLLSALLLGLAINLSPYYLSIALPVALLIQESKFIRQQDTTNQPVTAAVISARAFSYLGTGSFLISAVAATAGLIYASFMLMGGRSWEFALKSYGFLYNAEELTPNIGLFWYFFTELFDHFRAFFIFVLQYHVFLYVIPLCIRFKKFPAVVLWGQIAIICAFKAYPAAGDVALYLALIPLLVPLLTEISYAILLSIVWIYVMFLLPVMWRMWVWTGTGNANFYYALNLVIALAQSMLIVDVMSSVLKRDFLIRTKLKEIKDKAKAE